MLAASCHCGAVALTTARAPRKLTQCNCSICRRYGAVWAYYRRKSVQVHCEPGALAAYSWRNHSLRFYRCANCGCVTHHGRATPRHDGTDTLAVNVRNVDDPDAIAMLPIRMLDGASTWTVLDERAHPDLFRSRTQRERRAT
jgi:hypothetical protein